MFIGTKLIEFLNRYILRRQVLRSIFFGGIQMSKKMGYFFVSLGIAAVMVTSGLGELEYRTLDKGLLLIKSLSFVLFLVGMIILYSSELKLRLFTILIIVMKVFRHRGATKLVAKHGGCSNFYRWAVSHGK